MPLDDSAHDMGRALPEAKTGFEIDRTAHDMPQRFFPVLPAAQVTGHESQARYGVEEVADTLRAGNVAACERQVVAGVDHHRQAVARRRPRDAHHARVIGRAILVLRMKLQPRQAQGGYSLHLGLGLVEIGVDRRKGDDAVGRDSCRPVGDLGHLAGAGGDGAQECPLDARPVHGGQQSGDRAVVTGPHRLPFGLCREGPHGMRGDGIRERVGMAVKDQIRRVGGRIVPHGVTSLTCQGVTVNETQWDSMGVCRHIGSGQRLGGGLRFGHPEQGRGDDAQEGDAGGDEEGVVEDHFVRRVFDLHVGSDGVGDVVAHEVADGVDDGHGGGDRGAGHDGGGYRPERGEGAEPTDGGQRKAHEDGGGLPPAREPLRGATQRQAEGHQPTTTHNVGSA